MHQQKWLIAYGKYEGLEKRAVELLVQQMQPYLKRVIVVKAAEKLSEEEKKENSLVLVGTKESNPLLCELLEKGALQKADGEEGYVIVGDKNPFAEAERMLAVLGYTERGVLYGAVDAMGVYFGELARIAKFPKSSLDVRDERYFPSAFNADMPPFFKKSSPKTNKRAIWTWGHCIYDYRRFFKNMAMLKLNQAVIWNDFVPVNAKEVVECAHSWGIEIFWGSPWGWDTSMPTEAGALKATDEVIERLVKKYADEYADTGAAGLYFQSFTETTNEKIGGKYIAEAVVEFVNAVAEKMYEKYPDLQLQFGLHAQSVKKRIFAMEKVNPNIRIVWEDCGAMTYSYDPGEVATFEETLDFSGKIATLRGEKEKFGAVFKGMPTLDWAHFEHIRGEFMLGESSDRFLKERDEYRRELWKHYQADWLINGGYALETVRKLTAQRGGDLSLQLLVEDGMFEENIYFPTAFLAEVLWAADDSKEEIIKRVASCSWVQFANV